MRRLEPFVELGTLTLAVLVGLLILGRATDSGAYASLEQLPLIGSPLAGVRAAVGQVVHTAG